MQFAQRGLLLLLAVAEITAAALAAPADAFGAIAAAYRVEQNREVRWHRAADQRLPPASLTKLMTALLVVEDGRLQQYAQIDRAAARETGSRIGLRVGERIKVADLLAASLIASANDACHALAVHVAGSQEKFV